MKKTLHRLSRLGARVHIFCLLAFAVAALFLSQYELAAAEGAVAILLVIFSLYAQRRRQKELAEYVESVVYDTENAKSHTLMDFPLPIAVFRLDDSRIVWGNEQFFSMCGETGNKLDASIADMVPQFSGVWLLEGKTDYPTLLELGGRKYQLHGSLIHSDKPEDTNSFMGITYWVDVTGFDDIRMEYEATRPVAGVIVIDNLDELTKNQPDRVKNDLRDAIEDKLNQWCEGYSAILRRYDRDRYILAVEKRDLERMMADKFRIIKDMHGVESSAGISASISVGLGINGATLSEDLQYADKAVELALSRGGDQVVVKNRIGFEFFGGRGGEVERRTKVKSRVMANTLTELVKDSSRVLVMGHRYADLDSVGAAVGVCCLARKCAVKAYVVIDDKNNAAVALIDMLKKLPEYRETFISPREARTRVDARTLLVVVDTNRPEQVEEPELINACGRVAVIDHHRVAATYVHNAALGFIEPYASSTCELMTEILQEVTESEDITKGEAEAMLAGIVLDTKSFTLRTGERTFDAASYLRRVGADTVDVKKLLQTDMEDTVARYRIMQSAKLYRGVAIASPTDEQNRIVAAQAADELLNISGVDASIVVAPDGNGGTFASARSIGDINVQIIMEKLGGGGNRSAAAAQFKDINVPAAVQLIYSAIDEYLG